MWKQAFLAAVLVLVMGNSLFAHEKGDIFIIPEGQIGLEIPNIHRNGEHGAGDYVSLGLDWAVRVTAGYFFTEWFSLGTGLGFGGFHDTDNYNSRDTNLPLTETYTYDAGYLIIPVGFRVNRNKFAAGAGLTGHIPVFFNLSSVSRQTNGSLSNSTNLGDDNFKIHPFLGGYIEIGYDLAGPVNRNQGLGIFLRAQFPFDKNIAESDSGYKSFQHAGISLIFNYCFRIFSAPPGK